MIKLLAEDCRMSRKYNSAFLNSYIELDKICSHKFGIVSGGITEYVNRLISAKYAPDREQVLPRLVRYRNIRNRIAHEAGALQSIDEITKADVKWIEEFIKDIDKKRDPISLYLRKARKYAKRRRVRRRVIGTIIILLVLAAAAAVFFFWNDITAGVGTLSGIFLDGINSLGG